MDARIIAEKMIADGYTSDPLVVKLFDTYHEVEELQEKVHLFELKMRQLRHVLTCGYSDKVSVIAALSIVNDVKDSEFANVSA
jgi:hypothetical protein